MAQDILNSRSVLFLKYTLKADPAILDAFKVQFKGTLMCPKHLLVKG